MLENFLRNQAESGRHVSEGQFTLSAEQALRKLSHYGLDGHESILLRIVQYCVAAEAESIEVSLGRDQVTLWGRGLRPDSFLLSKLDDRLQTLLLACVNSGFCEATMRNPEQAWTFQGSQFTPKPDRSIARHFVLELKRDLPRGFWNRFRTSLQSRSQDLDTLHSKTGYSAVPVLLDKRRSRPSRNSRKLALELKFLGPGELRCQGIAPPWTTSKSSVHLKGEQVEQNQREDYEVFGKVLVAAHPRHFNPALAPWRSGKVGSDCILAQLYANSATLNKPGWLDFVKDGCLVGRLPWPDPVEIHGVASAVGLDTDASGLKLVENRKLEDLLDYLPQIAAESARKLMRYWPEGPCAETLQTIAMRGRSSARAGS